MPELSTAIDETLDRADPVTGPVRAEIDGHVATVDLERAGPVGVRIRGVRVDHGGARGIADEAHDLAERIRGLPERIAPVEVDPRLGGAVLRTQPGEVEGGEFTEVRVDSAGAEVKRLRPKAGGGREEVGWDLTRRDLRRLIDSLDAPTRP